jgi:hypothetical protein
MEPNLKQEKFKKILDELVARFNESMTRDEVLAIAKKLAEHVKQIEARTIKDVQAIHKTLSGVVIKMKEQTAGDVSSLKQEVKELVVNELKRISSEHSSKMLEVDDKISMVKNGEDADEDVIVGKVLEKIEIPEIEEIENSLPRLGSQIRDSLELLQGDNRLDISAIKGIEELLNSVKGSKLGGGGGGFSKLAFERYVVDDETPTGLVNNINTDFVLSRTPSGSSLKVYVNGQRLRVTEDYTVSGRTITFLTAPQTNSIILCDYRS